MFNSNTLHNALNVVILVCGAIAGFDWSVLAVFGLSAAAAAKIVSVAAAVKLAMNAFRDGIGGMIKNQPPVK